MKHEHQLLHQKFRQYGLNAKMWMRKCILLLPEIDRHRIWKQKGFGSIYEYAAKLAGMSHDTVNEALRILDKIKNMPALQKVVEEKGLGAVKPVVTVVTSETESFWVEKARVMSKNTLETYVRELKKQSETNDNKSPNNQVGFLEPQSLGFGLPRKEFNGDNDFGMKQVTMELELQVIQELEKLKGKEDWSSLFKQLLQIRKAYLEEQKPEAVKTESRHIPMRVQNHVVRRTNGQCSFPGCKKPYRILHHTQRFALEKIHDPDRLEPLCREHERIAHHGLIEHEEQPSRFWRIRKRPDESLPKYAIDRIVEKKRHFP